MSTRGANFIHDTSDNHNQNQGATVTADEVAETEVRKIAVGMVAAF